MVVICWQDQLPRDLVMTFQTCDQDLIRHLIGDERYLAARDLNFLFTCELGRWNMDTQTVDAKISVSGQDRSMTFWLLKYS